MVVVLGFYISPTAKVIRRRDLGLKSHPKDWRSPGSNKMLQAKFQDHRTSGSGEEDFQRFLPYEPRSEKTGLRGFRPGLIQTRLYSYRKWLEA